tara:strand:+ start:37360 stop:37740 length:381 start_codon:yes stop_codon:yes gene_type:complete
MIVRENKLFPSQPPEKDFGNKEYKLHLLFNERKYKKKNMNKFDIFLNKRGTQMLYRIYEGDGKALYIIGIDDNGSNIGIDEKSLNTSLENIKLISETINAKVKSIRLYNGDKGTIATVRIYKNIFI